jgi:tetratricopeptide (TPR) repeat protein
MTVGVFALVMVTVAAALGVWAAVAGNSGVFGHSTGLVGVCLLLLAVVVAAVGIFAWAQDAPGPQRPSPDSAVVLMPMPDSAGQDTVTFPIAQDTLTFPAFMVPEVEQLPPEPQPPADPVAAVAEVRAADQGGVCTGVLELMSVLSEAGIRRDLVQAGMLSGRPAVDVHAVDEALEQLAQRSLLYFSPDSPVVTAHRPVLQAVRVELAGQGRLVGTCRTAAAALETRSEALAGSQDRPAVRDIPRQVAALRDVVAGLGGRRDAGLAEALLRLQGWALYHLNALGDSAHAIAVGEPLIAAQEQVLGPDHPETLAGRNNLANAYQMAGRLEDAIALHEQVLAVRERTLGPDHPDTLASRKNLAAARRAADPAGEAIALHEQVLTDREQALGPDHPDTLASRNNLAVAYQAAGRTDEAIALHEQALADRERTLGPDHPATLNSRSNLAVAYQAAGRLDEAIALDEQVLADRERVLGADHPDTQAARSNLANALQAEDSPPDDNLENP